MPSAWNHRYESEGNSSISTRIRLVYGETAGAGSSAALRFRLRDIRLVEGPVAAIALWGGVLTGLALLRLAAGGARWPRRGLGCSLSVATSVGTRL